MIAARKGSPLAVGHGDGEMFVGSDAIALAPFTDEISYLEEGDFAVLTRNSLEIRDQRGAIANREKRKIVLENARVDKDGHKHFMAKEIAEQPVAIDRALKAYMTDNAEITLPEGLDFTKVERLTMVACGTAFYACMVAKYWFERIARLPVEVDVASEFRYREPPVAPNTLALFVSQSGETADTLAALRYMDGKAEKIVGLVNVPESSIARESDVILPLHAGPEISVASTKAFTCQLSILLLLALRAAEQRGLPLPDGMPGDLRSLPGLIHQSLAGEKQIAASARSLAKAQDIIFLGRGQLYPLALEGALKLKELSYIHAEGYASGELKHGPIALIDEKVPVVVLAPRDELFEKTVSNMQEVMARGGKVILVTDAEGAKIAGEGTHEVIIMPQIPDALAPILYAVPAQQIAYFTAIAKGTDVDQPRNLAKSVTVE